jgi:5-methylcytosine-specific restriction enzyme subunit McrC
MYQMYAYSKKYNTPEVWLLYPLNEEMQNADISFQASNRDVVETKVRLFFVEVIGIKESLGELKRQLIKEIHHHFL